MKIAWPSGFETPVARVYRDDVRDGVSYVSFVLELQHADVVAATPVLVQITYPNPGSAVKLADRLLANHTSVPMGELESALARESAALQECAELQGALNVSIAHGRHLIDQHNKLLERVRRLEQQEEDAHAAVAQMGRYCNSAANNYMARRDELEAALARESATLEQLWRVEAEFERILGEKLAQEEELRAVLVEMRELRFA